MVKAKTLAQQIAELANAAPQDFDPEEDRPVQESDEDRGSEESDDGLDGTDHYVEVGKSKLRVPEEVALGPGYEGSRVSREALLNDEDDELESNYDDATEGVDDVTAFADPEGVEIDFDDEDGDIDSEVAFGEGDSEKFKDFTFRGSRNPNEANAAKKRAVAADFMSDSEEADKSDVVETDEDILDVTEQHAEEEQSEEEESFESSLDRSNEEPADDESDDSSQSGDEDGEDEKERRAELRQIMNEEQKIVVDTISHAVKADADKGNAVKRQRKAFDSLLNIRIRLQKALVATNSMTATNEKDVESLSEQPYHAAEEAAIKLWNTLDGIRHDLSKASKSTKTGQKRKRDIDTSTTSSIIWERMQMSEVSTIDTRQTTLEKWSAKVRGTTALPLSRKLNPNATQQSITSVLQDQLASSDHLVKRTKMPRSCAPIQAKLKVTEDPNIYDDADFYQMLLKELVDQRMAGASSSGAPGVAGENSGLLQWTAAKEAKTRKNVDTKASKGRKMRYTVHEKLQNFMAPEDRGSWEQIAVDRFFGTLLGQKMNLIENEAGFEDGDEHENGVPLEEESLMLFRS